MQFKEFEALTLKECLQLVRSEMGPDAVILETRKLRRGGLMGVGAHDAVAIVAATGITVDSESQGSAPKKNVRASKDSEATPSIRTAGDTQCGAPEAIPRPWLSRSASAALVAARGIYGVKTSDRGVEVQPEVVSNHRSSQDAFAALLEPAAARSTTPGACVGEPSRAIGSSPTRTRSNDNFNSPARHVRPDLDLRDASIPPGVNHRSAADGVTRAATDRIASAAQLTGVDRSQIAFLERSITEIRECLTALQQEQRDSHDRTVSAVVSAVAPAVSAVRAAGFVDLSDGVRPRFSDLMDTLRRSGVAETLIQDLFDQLPDMGAWSEQAQEALAISALRDLLARRVVIGGPIELTQGAPKVVALIGPTGVGKTTTIAKLAANFALVQNKRVALLTVDTYRIAAVEQLKTYGQIIGLPVSVAYQHDEVPAILEQYSEMDLILIDTAGRSQQHASQIEELKSLLEVVNCETHLVLSAQTKEADMVNAARRFAAARVDRLIFSKLDETVSYGTLLNVADQTGAPLSYYTTGQKVPEDIEPAAAVRLAALILD